MNRMTTTSNTDFTTRAQVPGTTALNGLQVVFDLPYTVFNLLKKWQCRHASRAHLRTLDACHLADMGMTRADRDQEAAKAFWQA